MVYTCNIQSHVGLLIAGARVARQLIEHQCVALGVFKLISDLISFIDGERSARQN